jgi:hypothetical protein
MLHKEENFYDEHTLCSWVHMKNVSKTTNMLLHKSQIYRIARKFSFYVL